MRQGGCGSASSGTAGAQAELGSEGKVIVAQAASLCLDSRGRLSHISSTQVGCVSRTMKGAEDADS